MVISASSFIIRPWKVATCAASSRALFDIVAKVSVKSSLLERSCPINDFVTRRTKGILMPCGFLISENIKYSLLSTLRKVSTLEALTTDPLDSLISISPSCTIAVKTTNSRSASILKSRVRQIDSLESATATMISSRLSTIPSPFSSSLSISELAKSQVSALSCPPLKSFKPRSTASPSELAASGFTAFAMALRIKRSRLLLVMSERTAVNAG